MTRLRALWIVRENLRSHPGGDTTQILHTAAALERRGVSIRLAAPHDVALRDCDVVHLFHLDRLWEHVCLCRRIRARRIPAVLSTIYWPADQFDRRGRAGSQGLLARTVGSAAYQSLRLWQRGALHSARHRTLACWDLRLSTFRRAARYLLETVAVILPNSSSEQQAIEERFGVRRPAVVVPNAADAELYPPPEVFSRTGRAGVLSVGRIEPRKNQLALIRALRSCDVPLTIVGQPGRFSRRYADRCRRAAGPTVAFRPHARPAELRALYRAALVHACVSWYETPGLASLEAGLSGCNLVLTPFGSPREYFGDQADYCQPDDERSIREAVERALARPIEPALARRIAREFTWDHAAARTLEGYERALAPG